MDLNALRSVLLADASAEELATMSRADLSQWLRGREQLVEEYKRNLFSVKNSLLPVARLPTEVVVHIFIALQESLRTWNTRKLCEWVRVMHVCRRWRSIAHTTPELWTTVAIYRKCDSYARECCERSYQLSLKVYIHSSSDDVADILQRMLRPHEARIQLLRIWPKDGIRHNYEDNWLRDYLGNTLSKLENLEIHGFHFSYSVVVDQFHSAQFPCLRQLVLRDMRTLPSQADLPGLKSLSLVNILDERHTRKTRVPPKRFVEFLRNFGDLEYLYMTSSVPRHTKTPLSPAALPKLRALRCVDKHVCLFRGLQHTEFPPTTRVELWADTSGNPDPIVARSELMPSKFLSGTPSLSAFLATLRFVKIESDHNVFVLSGWRDIGLEQYPDDAALILRNRPENVLYHNWHRATCAQPTFLPEILSNLMRVLRDARTPLVRLCVRANMFATGSSVWAEFLSHFPQLKHIGLVELDPQGDLVSFARVLGGFALGNETATVCPVLEALELTARLDLAAIIQLANVLESRATRGVRLEILTLHISGKRVEMLEEYDVEFHRLGQFTDQPPNIHWYEDLRDEP